jgi:hypothetical protein
VGTNTSHPPASPAGLGWSDLALGAALAVLLWIALAALRVPGPGISLLLGATCAPPPAERSILSRVHLSSAEERRVRAALAEARESRRAAIAFYETLHEADAPGAPPATKVHAAEIDELVEGTLRGRLAEALGPARAELVIRPLAEGLRLGAPSR